MLQLDRCFWLRPGLVLLFLGALECPVGWTASSEEHAEWLVDELE